MFTRATSRSYTCLKCQYRLGLRESTRIESQNVIHRTPRRWQTSAATAIVEEEEGKDSVSEPLRDFAEKPKSRTHYTRTWRPTPTAQIGGNVLGKPAEILVLPASKRRRKKGLKDDDDEAERDATGQEASEKVKDDQQLKIHESLAQESKPGSMKEALENIEKIRDEANRNATDGSLPGDKWIEYHKGVSTGFTKKQLDRYLNQNITVLRSMKSDGIVSIKSFSRPRAATEIMTKLWGFSHDVPKDSSVHVSRLFMLGRGNRELILGVDREWRRFLNHVTIEPTSNSGEIVIAGPESWVNKTFSVFTSLKKRLRSRTLALPTVYAIALKEQGSPAEPAAYSTLQELMQKHEIIITTGSQYTAYSFHPESIDVFERELILAQQTLPLKSGSSITTSLTLSPDTDITQSQVPVYDSVLASQPPQWYRLSLPKVSSNASSTYQLVDAQSEKFQNLAATLRSQFCDQDIDTLGYTLPDASRSMIGGVTTEPSISIGQTLHKKQKLPHVDGDNLDAKMIAFQSAFAPTIPLLRQFLARQEILPQQEVTSTGDLLSLNLLPSNPHYPKMQVTATISFSTTAVEMNIESVKLVFPTSTAYVAIPAASNDLQFSRIPSVTIFQRGDPVSQVYAPFLGQLASQIRHQYDDGRSSTKLNLNKVLDLDIKCLETALETEGAIPSRRKTSSMVRYALERAEVLEKRRYKVSGQDDVLLEHTSYLPLKASAKKEVWEGLTVVPAGGKAILSDGEQFVGFVRSAVAVVEILDGFVRERTEEMVKE